MRGRPTTKFLAEQCQNVSDFLFCQGRSVASKWMKQAGKRLELLDCELRNERARQGFLEAMQEEREKHASR